MKECEKQLRRKRYPVMMPLMTGETVISERICRIFTENGLTGFQTYPITHEGKPYKTKINCMQLCAVHTMKPLSPPTKIVSKDILFKRKFVRNDEFYYNKADFENANDLNITYETFGTDGSRFPEYHGKLWVLSKKTVEIMICQLGEDSRKFVPVLIADDT